MKRRILFSIFCTCLGLLICLTPDSGQAQHPRRGDISHKDSGSPASTLTSSQNDPENMSQQNTSGTITETDGGHSDNTTSTPPSGVITITPKTALRSRAASSEPAEETGSTSISTWSSAATKALIQYEEPEQPKADQGAPQLRPLQ